MGVGCVQFQLSGGLVWYGNGPITSHIYSSACYTGLTLVRNEFAVNRRLQVSYYAADSSYHGRGVEGVAAVVAFEDGSVFVVA